MSADTKATTEPRHGGCADCGSKREPILTSVVDPNQRLQSRSVCSECFKKYPESRS